MSAEAFETHRYIPAKDVAKTVRARLKTEFPGVKFNVRTEHGSAVNIRWADGPRAETVDRLLCDLKGGHFDGMTDMYEYETELVGNADGTFERISYGSKYVFTHREISDEWRGEILALFAETIGRDVVATPWHPWLDDLVPLAVDRQTGRLLHMVETETERVSTVLHQYAGARAHGVACQHKAERLYAWTAYDGTACIACNDCGEVLLGGC